MRPASKGHDLDNDSTCPRRSLWADDLRLLVDSYKRFENQKFEQGVPSCPAGPAIIDSVFSTVFLIAGGSLLIAAYSLPKDVNTETAGAVLGIPGISLTVLGAIFGIPGAAGWSLYYRCNNTQPASKQKRTIRANPRAQPNDALVQPIMRSPMEPAQQLAPATDASRPEPEQPKQLVQLEQDCEAKVRAACEQLGQMYLRGTSVKRDMDKARAYFEKAAEIPVNTNE